MGNTFGNQNKNNTTIRYSAPYYDQANIATCKCTPPAEICVYGVCFWPLMSVTKQKMQWLEQANHKDNDFLRYKVGEIVYVKSRTAASAGQTNDNLIEAIVVEDLGSDSVNAPTYRLQAKNDKDAAFFKDTAGRQKYFAANEIENRAYISAYNNLTKLQNESTCCCGAIKTEGYYGNGWTSSTLLNIVAQQALNDLGNNNQTDILGNLYAANAVMNMRNQLDNSNQIGSFTACLKTVFCSSCINCNNAYVVNEAVKTYLRANPTIGGSAKIGVVDDQPLGISASVDGGLGSNALDKLLF